jgi:hypothetical protein
MTLSRSIWLGLLASSAAVMVAAAPATAQSSATYNTDVFPYWHLTAEGWNLPPLPPEQAAAVHDYAYSLALQAAVWGYPLTTFYSLRYKDAVGPKPHASPGEIWRMSDISTPKLSEESGYVTPNVNTVASDSWTWVRNQSS